MSRSRDGRTLARELLGGDVEAQPRLSAEPVKALIERVRRAATRATALAEAAGPGDPAAATFREVAEALAGHVETLRAVLANLTDDPEPKEADG